MEYIHLSVMGAVAGTISVILVYIYLYFMYRERFLGIWIISWTLFFLRNILFDTGIYSCHNSISDFIMYQLLFYSCEVTFLWGTYTFINKSLEKHWIYAFAAAISISSMLMFVDVPLSYKVIPSAWMGTAMLIRSAIAFLKDLEFKGIGNTITGYAFMVWAILTLIFPFSIQSTSSFFIWASFFSAIIRLTIAISTLFVYLEKTRNDLINKEIQYRRLTENAIDIIYRYRLTPKTILEYISPAVLAVTGYAPAEYYANSQLFFNMIHPEDTPVFDKLLTAPTSIANSQLPLAFRLIHKDGSIVWVEQKHVIIYDANGSPSALESIMRDVTARTNLAHMTAALERMNLVGNMAATVAHEIRNPMTTVRGLLQFLARKSAYQPDKDHFDTMIGEVDRANTIISEYLSLSQEKISQLTPCSLNQIIELIFPLMEATAVAAKSYIKLALSAIPDVLLDKKEIRQLLLNMVRNGIEAMPSGGCLRIGTAMDNNRVLLSIADQGSGIPSHILPQLGTPFLTTKDMGAGLGLVICFRIAHRHHVEIKIDTGEHGTTFCLYFPVPTS